MPSSYSKKRKQSREKSKDEEKVKSPGGPLKRTGKQAHNWDEALEKSLEVISSKTRKKQDYSSAVRSHHIELPNSSINMIAGMIADEVVIIWKKARIPTVSRDDCIKRVVKTIDMW